MRIDKTGQIIPASALTEGKALQKPAGKDPRSGFKTDRVDLTGGSSIGFMQSVIKNNIDKVQKQGVSAERLEAIKQKISEGRYYVNTDDIVKSMLEP